MPTCSMTQMVAVASDVSGDGLRNLLHLVGQAGINITAHAADDNGTRLFCDEPARLKQVITDAGLFCHVVDVLSIQVDDRPGQLDHIATTLGNAGVQILSIFGMGIADHGQVFVRVDNPTRALEALQ